MLCDINLIAHDIDFVIVSFLQSFEQFFFLLGDCVVRGMHFSDGYSLFWLVG